jgi:hypothetical protein
MKMTSLVVADLEISSELDRDARCALRGGVDLGALNGMFGVNSGTDFSSVVEDGGLRLFSPTVVVNTVVNPQLLLQLNTVTQNLTNIGAIIESATSSITRS